MKSARVARPSVFTAPGVSRNVIGGVSVKLSGGFSVHMTDVLVELDKENLRAQVRESRANLQAAKAAEEAADAQLKKDRIAAEAPDLEFARRNYDRARQLFDQKLVSPQSLDDARNAM